jgi:hypothetical protein
MHATACQVSTKCGEGQTPAGRITGRKKHDAFGQEVHAVTSAAGWLGAYSTNNAANEQAFTRLLQVCPDPTIKELAKSYRVDPYISAQIIQNVVPAIAAHIRNRDTEISTKELLAAGSTLIALWCRGNATLSRY